jgi:hypothetical protein
VLVLFVANVIITLIFRADVEAQSGAYATGVLVLILSAAFAAMLGPFGASVGGAWLCTQEFFVWYSPILWRITAWNAPTV